MDKTWLLQLNSLWSLGGYGLCAASEPWSRKSPAWPLALSRSGAALGALQGLPRRMDTSERPGVGVWEAGQMRGHVWL